MAKNKRNTGAGSQKAKAAWVDPDDAPPLGKAFFERARLNKAGKPERGRPPLESPKKAVSLRLDADVVSAYKARGDGWQSLINADLRKSSGLAMPKPASVRKVVATKSTAKRKATGRARQAAKS